MSRGLIAFQESKLQDNDKIASLLQAEKVLLVNPPVYDTRLPWARWAQPTFLLRLGARFRCSGAEVKLIDAISHKSSERLKRKRITSLNLDGINVYKWRYGLPETELKRRFADLKQSAWQPDVVWVQCLTTFWWEGAREAISLIKQTFPSTRVVISGAYSLYAPTHAKEVAGADEVVNDSMLELAHWQPDLGLYETVPPFAYLSLSPNAFTEEEVVGEVVKALRRGVRHFAFSDHGIVQKFPEFYKSVLESLITEKLRISFYTMGSISASDLVAQPDLPVLMKEAGYAMIVFSDDRHTSGDPSADEQLIEDYAKASELCGKAGFKLRTEALSASLCIGRRGENLASRVQVASHLVHHMGSVIFWPYQPHPDECPDVPLEGQNGKLFPFRADNSYTYRDYLNVLGIGTVLNAKYRSQTFDFLGDGLTSRLFRESVVRRGWDPDPEVKGSIKLPMRGPK